jgi:large-conductance mechanosensitive channel
VPAWAVGVTVIAEVNRLLPLVVSLSVAVVVGAATGVMVTSGVPLVDLLMLLG